MAKEKSKTLSDWTRWVYRTLKKKRISAEETPLINELEQFLDEYPDETSLEKWLGFLYLMIDHKREAERIFTRLSKTYPHDSEIQTALAYLYLLQGNTDKAATLLLDALYIDEKNPMLKRNLELLRSTADLPAWLATHAWTDFVFFELPQSNWWEIGWGEFLRHPLVKTIVLSSIVVTIGAIGFLIYPHLLNIAQKYQQSRFREIGAIVDSYSIQDIEKLVEERQKYSIKLTDEEINKKFEILKDLLYEGKRNQALILINELLNSNASEKVKEHIRIFESFVPLPNPRNIDYNPSCRDVLRAPFLYKDVYINWVGTVANLFFHQRKETSFDLLINFVDEATVEGIATIKLPGFESEIRNGRKIRVFGRIAGIQIDNKVIILDPTIQYLDK